MGSQSVAVEETIAPAFIAADVPGIFLPSGFKIQAADANLIPKSNIFHRQAPAAVLTPQQKFGDALIAFNGAFTGPGFNTIFRPNSQATPTKDLPGDFELLELNLTHETWSFSNKDLGDIPNRGFIQQKDINLVGKVYTQTVLDVTDISSGRRMSTDRTGKLIGTSVTNTQKPREIHFEPGMFLSVPATQVNPELGPTICRMASIPHGVTINAQGAAAETNPGRPSIPSVNITPFGINNEITQKSPSDSIFKSQKFAAQGTARLPQDLSKFETEKTITADLLANPNSLLEAHNKDKDFVKTTTFVVSTALPGKQFSPQRAAVDILKKAADFMENNPNPNAPQELASRELDRIARELEGATSTANIAFLDGSRTTGQTASAAKVTARFWISTVNYKLQVKTEWKPKVLEGGQKDVLRMLPKDFAPNLAAGTVPTFAFPADKVIKPQTVSVPAVQIQYSQTILLNFNGRSWPHVSVATVVPLEDVQVPANLVQ